MSEELNIQELLRKASVETKKETKRLHNSTEFDHFISNFGMVGSDTSRYSIEFIYTLYSEVYKGTESKIHLARSLHQKFTSSRTGRKRFLNIDFINLKHEDEVMVKVILDEKRINKKSKT